MHRPSTYRETSHKRLRKAPLVVAVVVLAIAAGGVTAWRALRHQEAASTASWSVAPTAGDPGGKILRAIAPYAKVVPAFSEGKIHWLTNIGWPPPASYAYRAEPQWDSCDGRAGTFGWDPAHVEIDFQWSGSAQALMEELQPRLRAVGFTHVASIPSWDGAGALDGGWVKEAKVFGPVVLVLTPPGPPDPSVPTVTHQWSEDVEALPHGRLPSGC